MRRTLTFIFALFYTLASSGAPALLHFCGHEQNVHLSLAHEDHHSAPSCCHSEVESCHAPQPKLPISADEEDCCISSSVDLDESQFVSQELTVFLFTQENKQTLKVPTEIGAVHFAAHGPVQNNGPPLYLKYQQIIVYG